MKRIYKTTMLIAAIMLAIGCDKIDSNDYLTPAGSKEWLGQKILIEEFTGQRCPNCPKAAQQAEVLTSFYGDKVVIVAIHSGSFAMPVPAVGFTFDFRTTEGDELNKHYNITNYPSGLINRIERDGSPRFNYTDWSDVIKGIVYNTPDLVLSSDCSYDTVSRKLSVHAKASFLKDIDYNANINVIITESGLIGKQSNGDQAIENYEHKHVMRKMFNGTWGESFFKNTDNIKKSTEKMYSKEVELDANWNAANCNAVIVITNTDTKQVVQVDEVKLKNIINP